MAGTITKLEIQKKNKERVNVYVDDSFALAVSLNVALGLKKGQFLGDAEIEQLRRQDERHKAYDRALFYLGFRARSRAEMERYLRGKEFLPETIEATLTRLAAEGYLDDAAFAQSWTGSRQRTRPKSRRALRHELRQKGVDREAIEAALADMDEAEAAAAALGAKLRQWQHLDEETYTKKAMGFLSRRGFSYSVARAAVEAGRRQIDDGLL
ncbi:MAG: RecX family transcriptional regulator [Anaerolineae bacterium]